MKCMAEECTRKVSHRVMWKDTDLSITLCNEHFNVFINDQLQVTTDLESPWRNESRAQKVLDELADQGLNFLEEGDLEKAGQALGMVHAHITNCGTHGVVLNEDRAEELERRLIGDVV